jgi:hypothetical protein
MEYRLRSIAFFCGVHVDAGYRVIPDNRSLPAGIVLVLKAGSPALGPSAAREQRAALADDFEPRAAFCGPICGLRKLVLDDLNVPLRGRHRGLPGEALRDGRRAEPGDVGDVGRPQIVEASRLPDARSFDRVSPGAAERLERLISTYQCNTQSVADAFDDEIHYSTAPDGARSALLTLRSATLQAISAAGADKARLVPYAMPRPRPALALAQLFYGDDADVAVRAIELVTRTGAIHRAFLPTRGERLSK